jgi:putative transposase
VTAIARALQVSRSNLLAPRRPKLARETDAAEDAVTLEALKAVASQRSTYGYRRAAAILNRERRSRGEATINHKRAYRLMRAAGLLLARYTGKPTRTHDGRVVTLKPDLRWCSDTFEIRCWNGERVQIAFSLDCCDREVIAFRASADYPTALTIRDLMAETVEVRFGRGTRTTPHPIEWLSDNGPIYTAYATRDFGRGLGLVICTTPSYSPESNGMAEGFVKTFKRDYLYVNELPSAAHVLAQLPAWVADYNRVAPHKGLKMLSPAEFRAAMSNP